MEIPVLKTNRQVTGGKLPSFCPRHPSPVGASVPESQRSWLDQSGRVADTISNDKTQGIVPWRGSGSRADIRQVGSAVGRNRNPRSRETGVQCLPQEVQVLLIGHFEVAGEGTERVGH